MFLESAEGASGIPAELDGCTLTLSDADGSDAVALSPITFSRQIRRPPAWSPDGRWIAAGLRRDRVRPEWGETILALVDTTASEPSLTWIPLPELGHGPTWDPDSSRLAVILSGPVFELSKPVPTQSSTYTIAVLGTDLVELFRGTVKPNDTLGPPSISWSPDGSVIALVGSGSLWFARPGPSDLTIDFVCDLPWGENRAAITPQWSDDGSLLAIVVGQRTWIYDLEAEALVPALDGQSVIDAVWMGSSHRLLVVSEHGAFAHNRWNSRGPMNTPIVFDADTGETTVLTRHQRRYKSYGYFTIDRMPDVIRQAFSVWAK